MRLSNCLICLEFIRLLVFHFVTKQVAYAALDAACLLSIFDYFTAAVDFGSGSVAVAGGALAIDDILRNVRQILISAILCEFIDRRLSPYYHIFLNYQKQYRPLITNFKFLVTVAANEDVRKVGPPKRRDCKSACGGTKQKRLRQDGNCDQQRSMFGVWYTMVTWNMQQKEPVLQACGGEVSSLCVFVEYHDQSTKSISIIV